MNKAIIFSIRPKWTNKIFNGEKDYEFRTKLPKDIKVGMTCYIYETKRKYYKTLYNLENPTKTMLAKVPNYGQGKVVGQFTVGDMYWYHYGYEKFHTYYDEVIKNPNYRYGTIDIENLQGMGFTNQEFAIKLDNIIKYDEPIALNEFVSWNKLQQTIKNSYGVDENNHEDLEDLYIDVLYEQVDFLRNNLKRYKEQGDVYLCKEFIQKAPQSYMYCVERNEQ